MKVFVSDLNYFYSWHSDLYPTDKEVKQLCKPGEGANTCIWLVVGSNGFECSFNNKNTSLLIRWMDGQTVAKRDGCTEVKGINIDFDNREEQEFDLLSDKYQDRFKSALSFDDWCTQEYKGSLDNMRLVSMYYDDYLKTF